MSPTEQTPGCKHFKLRLPLAIEWVDPLGAKRQAHTLSG
jgi:hypothetical protein